MCIRDRIFVSAEEDKTRILFGEIKSNIDPRTNRYSKLLIEEATNYNYDLVIIEMDTYGGAVNDADDIRTRILDFNKPIYVWINKDAASAGALISIACDSIYMSSGASIGAATVVSGDGTQAPDKYQSYMRSIMRSTAEAKGRDPKIAEAMVDQDIKVDSISQEGKVITFSTKEAIETFKDLGAEVLEISLPNVDLSLPVYYIIAPAECSANLSRYDGVRYGYRCENPKDIEDLYMRTREEGFGSEVNRRILIGTYALSAGYYDAYYLKAQKVRQLIKNDFDKVFNDVDAILTLSLIHI